MTQIRTLRLAGALSLLIAFMLVLAACGSDDAESSEPEPTEPPATSSAGDSETRGMVLGEQHMAYDFELTDHEGNPFTLSDHYGRVIAMFFGYTHCPDICPLTLSHMNNALEELGDQADDALFLYISVDPERDTPEQMKKYVSRADHEIIGLTGDMETMEPIWEAYDITVEYEEPDEDGSYLVGHSAQIWMINTEGEVAMVLPPSADGGDMAHDVRWLLRQST